MGLVVAGITDFDLSYVETLGSFSLNVVNIGISTASAVAVNLPRQKNFSITGSSNAVLGNLNPGDYTSAIFQVTKIPGAGNSLEIEIQYTDTSGQRHTIIKSLTVASSAAGTQSGAGRGTGNTNYTLWLLAGLVIILIYWQRKKITTYFRKPKRP